MSENKFPYLNKHIREDYPLTTEAIDGWFKRCLVDAPDYFWGNENIIQSWESNPGHRADMCLKYLAWREKWFSQFKEKGEDE